MNQVQLKTVLVELLIAVIITPVHTSPEEIAPVFVGCGFSTPSLTLVSFFRSDLITGGMIDNSFTEPLNIDSVLTV